MKFKLLFIIAILAGALYYLYQHPALKQKLFGSVQEVIPELDSTTLYKWKDSKGQWQYTDKPPAKGVPYTTLKTRKNTNVLLPSTKKPAP